MLPMFHCEIETATPAFGPDDAKAAAELCRILRLVIRALQAGERTRVLRDRNGRRVGRFDWREDDPP